MSNDYLTDEMKSVAKNHLWLYRLLYGTWQRPPYSGHPSHRVPIPTVATTGVLEKSSIALLSNYYLLSLQRVRCPILLRF